MPSLSMDDRRTINYSRTLGSRELPVYLEDHELLRLCAVIAGDLNVMNLVSDYTGSEEKIDYYSTPLQWFKQPVTHQVSFEDTYTLFKSQIDNFPTYFISLAELHKRRIKYDSILKNQKIPLMEQIVPRCLLEYGMKPSETLASWLVWRKWLYDIDNRAAQETGYLFEPILCNALGGVSYSAKKSPIRRAGDKAKGRQVDCIEGRDAYEFKMRVTIAASGQGRFREELDFARDCHDSGYTPRLLVLDPTPSEKLDDLINEYLQYGGTAHIGDDAWTYIEERTGKNLAIFIEKYVKRPILEVTNSYTELKPIKISKDGSSITIRIGEDQQIISRNQ